MNVFLEAAILSGMRNKVGGSGGGRDMVRLLVGS